MRTAAAIRPQPDTPGHLASDHDVTVHGKITIETSNDHKVHDRLTANRKQSENASGEIGHEHHPTESGPYDPSLLLQPKLGKPGRIANGSRPPKTFSTHHLAERVVMRGRADRGRGKAGVRCERETPGTPAPDGAEETEVPTGTGRASSSTSTPLAGHRSSRRGSPTGSNTRCIPRPPPSPPAIQKGGRKKGEPQDA